MLGCKLNLELVEHYLGLGVFPPSLTCKRLEEWKRLLQQLKVKN
jgi:hypothetical protein